MRIQHNIMALNAYRNYNNNIGTLSKNLEKLSSGYRINGAGDDAAGLAISEKMRAQITGLDAAQKNVKDGISLVKTAEGALQEVQDMMNRMKYLAVQSANGTYDNEVDRANLQKEVDALKTEINRIADSANFNGQKLLNGELAAEVTEVVVPEGTEMQDKIFASGTNATATVKAASGAATTVNFGTAQLTGDYDAFKITYTNNAGETKTLTLVEGAVGSAGNASELGKDFALAFNGGTTLNLSDTSSNAKEDLEEFKSLFTVAKDTSSDAKVVFTAKDPESAAKVTGVSYGTDSVATDAISGATAQSVSTVDAHDTYGEVVVSGTTADFELGNKTYQVTASDGATSNKEATKLLLEQLQKDGINAELDTSDANECTIKIHDMQELQKSTQIVNTEDDKIDVKASASTAGQAVIDMAETHAGGASSITLNYVNEAGENVSKTVEFTAAATGVANASALMAAIEGDAELKELFDVSISADTTGSPTQSLVTIASKGSGTGSAYITGVEISDAALLEKEIEISEPKDTGKEMTLATGKSFASGDQITIDGKTYQFMKDTGAAVENGVTKLAYSAIDANNWETLQKALEKDGVKAELLDANDDGTTDGLRFTDSNVENVATTETTGGGLTLQIGDTADDFNQMNVTVGDMHVEALGIGELDISTLEGAQAAVDKITEAINTVSSTRGDLGAIQNRLEHTTNNLAVMKENITDAESSIRDTDVADEMMKYTKNNILIQSAQAMLAQANAVPQGVLQLLQ